MQPAVVPLHRLLSRQVVEELLNSFRPLLGDSDLFLFDSQGTFFAGTLPALEGDGQQERDQIIQALSPGSDPIQGGGISWYPVAEGSRLAAVLATAAPPAVAGVIQRSLELFIAESRDKRSLARETLDRYREVNLLYHITGLIGTTLDEEEILKTVMSETRRAIKAYSGVVILWQPGTSLTSRILHYGNEGSAAILSGVLEKWVTGQGQITGPKIVSGLPEWPGLVMVAPMVTAGRALGIIALARETNQPEFQAGDEKLLNALASQAAIAIEKARLHHSELQRQRMEQELQLSERIQRSLLPASMPQIPGWDFAASYRSAGQIGGDFYDIYQLPGSETPGVPARWGISIADVTGKGIPAALMMAFSQAVLQVAAAIHVQPGDALYHANRLILAHSRSGLLLTAFFATLEPSTGLLQYSNAGHEPPFWLQASTGSCVEVECGRSLLIGAQHSAVYSQHSFFLSPGDMLVLYTDGVTEARSPTGEFFTEERLKDIVAACGQSTSSDLLQAILDALQEFTAGAPQSDDITLFIIRREREGLINAAYSSPAL